MLNVDRSNFISHPLVTSRLLVAGMRLLFTALVIARAPSIQAAEADDYSPNERAHWSFQRCTQPDVPVLDSVEERRWAAGPIDAFVLQRLRSKRLAPALLAPRTVLARRLHLNLTGLVPLPEEVADFADDASADSFERLVDRLLASPCYGEAWGQHWLDVVRYAETEGFEYDRHRAGAWRYRDYVIDSLNADKPYDQFVREQLAGDELPGADEPVRVAAGFHRLGPIRRNAGNTDVAFSRNEVLTEMTDAVGFVFLGMTVGCERCHDHKFDPIRHGDYYRLQAFLAATREHDLQIGSTEEVRSWNEWNGKVQEEIKKLRDKLDEAQGEERVQLSLQLREAQKRLPAPIPTISTVVSDAAQRTAIHVLDRGQTDRPKELVAPRGLGVLLPDKAPELSADVRTPRTVLADWIIATDHPLTARVAVNRLWQYHFGQGLVPTPNDFGVNGAAPSHPELLDHLARELLAGGWHWKRVHRRMLVSSTYRQSADSPNESEARTNDPDNRLLSHFSQRRLSAEELRDSLLAVSGRLNRQLGGPSVMPPVKSELTELLYDPEQWQVTPDRSQHERRSIYLIAKRNLRLPFLEVFDQPDLQISCSHRESSTHAPQALELLNGDLARELAAAFAQRLISDAGDEHDAQMVRAFALALGRVPTPDERRLALAFLAQEPLEEFALAMFNLNAFLYVE